MSRKAGLHAENYTVKEQVERDTADAETGLNQQQQTSEGLKIEGLALPFDKRSRNGVIYQKESVQEAAESLVGCSLLFNHDEDNPIGHIEDVEITDEGLKYYGDLNEERKEVESLKRGDIPHVSIQAMIEETGNTETNGEVAVTEFLEMSAVTVPGFSSTDVEASEETVMIEKLVTEQEAKKKFSEQFQFSVGDYVQWEFASGSAEGEIIDRTEEVGDTFSAGGNTFEVEEEGERLYKIQEFDDEQEEFTNNVVKFEDALSSVERPDEAPGTAPRNESQSSEQVGEGYEFQPIPSLVFYDNEGDARERANDLGVEGIHAHEYDGQTYYMAGETHGQWEQLVGKQSAEKLSEAVEDVDLTPPDAVKNAAQAALDAKEEYSDEIGDCGTGVGESRAKKIVDEDLEPEDFLGGENTAIPDYLDSHSEDVEGISQPPSDWGEEQWTEGCGPVQYALWGGTATGTGLEWANETEQRLREEMENNEEAVSKEPFAGYDDFDACVADNQDKADPEAYCAAIKKKAEITERILGENQDMTEQLTEQLEDVSSSEFYQLVAQVHENLSAEDVESLFEEFSYEGNVMEALESIAEAGDMDDEEDDDMEDEGSDGDMEDDEEEESTGSESSDLKQGSQNSDNDMEGKTREELENRVEMLEEKLMKLEDTEPSKQEAANTPTSKDGDGFSVRKDIKDRLER